MIRLFHETLQVPVPRMKRGKMKYRLTEFQEGERHHREMDAKALFKATVRKQWETIPGERYQSNARDVELNLAENGEEPQWSKVRGNCDQAIAPGKHDWALFLTTDRSLSGVEILESYSMRWPIEVYFKEAKQHLGFQKEQSNHYVASMHLTALRMT